MALCNFKVFGVEDSLITLLLFGMTSMKNYCNEYGDSSLTLGMTDEFVV
jgi:hypothetical protein